MLKQLDCGLSCLLASMLFGSMLYTMFSYGKHDLFKNFNNLLNEEQKLIYKKIMKERMRLYLEGLLIGLLLGFIYLQYSKKSIYSACVFASIILGVNNLYYLLHPKSAYMLTHLTTTEQNVAWLEIYKFMKNRCYMGMILGAAAYILVGYYAN